MHADAYGSGPEHDLLIPFMEGAIKRAKGFRSREKFYSRRTLIADTGFFQEENLEYLHHEKIDAFIPDNQFVKETLASKARDGMSVVHTIVTIRKDRIRTKLNKMNSGTTKNGMFIYAPEENS